MVYVLFPAQRVVLPLLRFIKVLAFHVLRRTPALRAMEMFTVFILNLERTASFSPSSSSSSSGCCCAAAVFDVFLFHVGVRLAPGKLRKPITVWPYSTTQTRSRGMLTQRSVGCVAPLLMLLLLNAVGMVVIVFCLRSWSMLLLLLRCRRYRVCWHRFHCAPAWLSLCSWHHLAVLTHLYT